jgi:hypothetical protein
MITPLIRVLVIICLTAAPLIAASNDFMLNASVVTVRKADANVFLSAIGSGVVSKEQMAALLRRGTLASTVVVRAKSGQRAKGGSTKFRVEVDVLVKDGWADLMIAPEEGSPTSKPAYKMLTAIKIKLGTTQLLGVNDEPGEGTSHFYFLTVQ